jgi:tripartite-type tricarboxylate transporter receptor subunit TctC
MGQPIVVTNIVGGSGTKGTLYVKNAEPDGYTLLNSWVAPHVLSPIFNPDVGYTRHDFEPLMLVQINPFTVAVKADHPAKNLKEFVEWARKQPGRLNVGICAAVSLPRMVMEQFLKTAKIENYNAVPFPGCGADNVKGLFDGSLDFTTGVLIAEKIFGKQIRSLAIFMDERVPFASHIPTAKEQGYDLGWGETAAGWSGLVASPKTPKDRLRYMINVFSKTVQSDEFLNRLNKVGIVRKYVPTEDFRQLWDDSHRLLKPSVERLLKK